MALRINREFSVVSGRPNPAATGESNSRNGDSERLLLRTTEDFFRCLENAFAHFGGVPKIWVIDNLKAAVAHPNWFDPQLTPKVQAFCRHYGVVILPTKPYLPRHKGKVVAFSLWRFRSP